MNLLRGVADPLDKVSIAVDALDQHHASDSLLDTILDLRTLCNVSLFTTSRFIPSINLRFEHNPTLKV